MADSQPKSQIETPTESYVARYPWAIEMAINQQDIFWPAHELGVEEDEQDFKIGLNEAEQHGVLTAQSFLTQLELMIGGDEMWGGKIAKLFPRPEIQRLCACFANVELNSHAPFYAIGNEVMGNHTDEFYSQWKADPVLAKAIAFMNQCTASNNPLEVTAALAFFEGAKLFSIFGFFKGFNTRGHSLISHFIAGIDGSAKDEDFHSRASATLFNICRNERSEAGHHNAVEEASLNVFIDTLSIATEHHEKRINALLFAKPGNRVVTQAECDEFVEDRIDVVRARLGRPPMFNRAPGAISGWFYDQLSTVKVPDFFKGTQLQYRRNWRKDKLAFNPEAVHG